MNLASLIYQKPYPIPPGVGRLHRIKTTADDFVSVLGKAQTCHECMRRDLAAMLTCDTLVLLDGWQKSAGAHLEMHVAHRVGMHIMTADEVVA